MGEGEEAGLIFSYSWSWSVHKKEGVGVGCAPNNFKFWVVSLEKKWTWNSMNENDYHFTQRLCRSCGNLGKRSGKQGVIWARVWDFWTRSGFQYTQEHWWKVDWDPVKGEKAEKEQNHSNEGLVSLRSRVDHWKILGMDESAIRAPSFSFLGPSLPYRNHPSPYALSYTLPEP